MGQLFLVSKMLEKPPTHSREVLGFYYLRFVSISNNGIRMENFHRPQNQNETELIYRFWNLSCSILIHHNKPTGVMGKPSTEQSVVEIICRAQNFCSTIKP